MKANNKNVNNDKKGKEKNGARSKITLIIIILIMAIIIGILSWLLISGKNFSTIFNNVEHSEKNENNNTIEQQQDDNKNNSNTKEDDEKKEDEDEDNRNGMATGKGGDEENDSINTNLKDSFKVTYETRGVRNITIEGACFVCNEDVPTISGISTSAAAKMEKYLNNWYSEVWIDINEQTKDEDIKELLNQMNENSDEYGPQDIGFHQTYKVIYLTNKLVTFQYILEGGLGGVSWGNTSGVSFDLETGDVIEIEKIVTSKEKYIEACKNYVFESLKKDSRYEEVLEMHGKEYEGIINSTIEKLEGYFTENGIVCAEIPKYSIASGASGEFTFTVPYGLIKDYINIKYIENVADNYTTKSEYTAKELEKMALDYYESQTGYRPTLSGSQVNDDGTILIQLYDNMGDHNSTSAWYTVDPKTGVGTDLLDNKVDLKVKVAR